MQSAGSGTINLKAGSALYEVPVCGCCICSPVSKEHACRDITAAHAICAS